MGTASEPPLVSRTVKTPVNAYVLQERGACSTRARLVAMEASVSEQERAVLEAEMAAEIEAKLDEAADLWSAASVNVALESQRHQPPSCVALEGASPTMVLSRPTLASFASMDRAVLALDAGTSSVKAVLVCDERTSSLRQHVLAEATCAHERPSGTGGVSEQQAESWWNSAETAIRSLGVSLRGIAAISLSGQMQSVILVGGNDGRTPLAPALLYSDSRAAEEAAELEARFGREVLEAKALNWKGAVSVLPKLLWLQKHTPQTVANATAIVLAAHDYLYLQLTGGHVTDRTNASTTGLLTR